MTKSGPTDLTYIWQRPKQHNLFSSDVSSSDDHDEDGCGCNDE